MKVLRLSSRATRRVLAGAGAVAITAGLSGVAPAADAITTSTPSPAVATVIKGCYDSTSGALRVITPHSKSCGSERKISWNQAGPAGNGYAFTSTSCLLDKFGGKESDGPVVTKPGTYFVNVTAQLNISSYTSGGAGFCALDLATDTPSINYIFEDFSAWNYPAAGSDIKGAYPFASSAMIHVSASQRDGIGHGQHRSQHPGPGRVPPEAGTQALVR